MSDLISREAVIKAMENNSFMVEAFGTKRKMIDSMMMCVEIANLPTVEAKEVVHGKWVLGDVKPGHLTPGRNSLRICSECGKVVVWWLDKPTENFCSNCGADMRGEKHA